MKKLLIFIFTFLYFTNIKAQVTLFFDADLYFTDTTIVKNKVKFMRYFLTKDSIQNIVYIADFYYDKKGRLTNEVHYNKNSLKDTAYTITASYFENKLIKQKKFIFYPKSRVFPDFCPYNDVSQYNALNEKKILGFANYEYKKDSVFKENYCTCNGEADSHKRKLADLIKYKQFVDDGYKYENGIIFDNIVETILSADSTRRISTYLIDSTSVNLKTTSLNDIQLWNKNNRSDTTTIKIDKQKRLLLNKTREGINEYFYQNNKLQTVINRFSTGELAQVVHVNFEQNTKKDGIVFDELGNISYFKLDYSQKGKIIRKLFSIDNEKLEVNGIDEYNTNGLLLRSSSVGKNSEMNYFGPKDKTNKSEVVYEYQYY